MENSAGISFMGFTRMDLESAVCFLYAVVFSLFLMAFSWQDLHRKRIRVSWLYGFGTAGRGDNGRNGAYDDTVCAVDYKRWMGLEKKCVADNGMAFGNAAGDFFVLDGAADERCGRTGRWLLFSDHWVLSGGMADA